MPPLHRRKTKSLNDLRNIWALGRVLLSDPVEFCDRSRNLLMLRITQMFLRNGPRATYSERMCYSDGLRALSCKLRRDLFVIVGESELHKTQDRISRLTSELEIRGGLPFPTFYNADSTIRELCYALCRVLEPEIVLETGIAYGASSAAILEALHKNGKGTLHSIDLPPLRDRESHTYIGTMVSPEYKHRWHMHLGDSQRELPRLFASGIGKVDVFLHDSGYQVTKVELDVVWNHMSSRGVLIVNNIGKNPAFAEFVKRKNLDSWFVIEQREKQGDLTGVILSI
jgi:predicted O-methyltransferase YrrM